MLAALATLAITPLAASCAQAPTGTGEIDARALKLFRSEADREAYAKLYKAVLEEWPAPHEQIYVPTRFGRTHVIASGPVDAPPMVLLHAMLTSAAVWRPNVEELSKAHRVYAVDVIGEPNLSEPTRRLDTRQDCADWLNDVMDGLEIERASIAGNSFGGYLALNQVILSPGRIDKAVLISPVGIAPLKLEFFWHVGLSMGLGMEKQLSDWFGAGVPWDSANDRYGALGALAGKNGSGLNASQPDFKDADMASVSRPLLLLIGDREVIYDVDKTMKRVKALIPGVETAVIPGANHVAAMARPADVNARIIAFVGKPAS